MHASPLLQAAAESRGRARTPQSGRRGSRQPSESRKIPGMSAEQSREVVAGIERDVGREWEQRLQQAHSDFEEQLAKERSVGRRRVPSFPGARLLHRPLAAP